MVVRRSIVERHPWVVLNVYNAFRLAKEQWLADLRASAQPHLELGMLPEGTEEALKRDPFPYGVASNRHVLETIAAYSHEQGLTPRALALDELFAPSTLEL